SARPITSKSSLSACNARPVHTEVPIPASCTAANQHLYFDHLVGEREQRWWDVEAERLGRPRTRPMRSARGLEARSAFSTPSLLISGLQSIKPSRRIVGNHIDQTVGTDPHVANAPECISQQALFANDASVLHFEPHQAFGDQSTDPEYGDLAHAFNRQPRWGDRGRPIVNWRLHALFRCALADRLTRIGKAMGYDRPAIIVTSHDQVQFITAQRPMLMGP